MAEWKKVVVSGSDISQLNNDANYLINGQSGASLTGSFSGSFVGTTNLPDLTSGEGISTFTYDGSGTAIVAVSGAVDLSNNAVTKWNDTDGKFANSSLTDNGTSITGTTSIQLTGVNSILSGSFSGSFQGNGSGLTNIPASGITGLNLSMIATGSVTASFNVGDGSPKTIINWNSTLPGTNLPHYGTSYFNTSSGITTFAPLPNNLSSIVFISTSLKNSLIVPPLSFFSNILYHF